MQKNQFMFIVGLLVCAIVAIFALINSQTVAINLFFYKFEGVSQAVVIFVSAALGALIVTLLGLVKHIILKNEVRRYKKETKDLIAQVDALTARTQDLTEKLQVAEAKNEVPIDVVQPNDN
ncbi:MAG: LapA family protein [Peptostreptococcales bacterium]